MRQVTIDEAKSQLSKLIQAALQGEEVIIGRGNQPLVRLAVLPEAGKQRRLGGMKGIILDGLSGLDAALEDLAQYLE